MKPWWIVLAAFVMLAPSSHIHSQQISEQEVKLQEIYLDAEGEMLLGNDEKAIELFQEVRRKDPRNHAAAYQMARLYMRQEQYEKALPLVREAVAEDEDNIWYHQLEADLFQLMGRYGEAARVYESMVSKAPDRALLYNQWAYQLVKSGQIKDAIKVYDKLEKRIGITEEAILRKHKLYLGLGDPKKAARELERLVNAYPSRTSYRHQLAAFYEQMGESGRANAVYEEILQIDPEDVKAKLALRGGSQTGDSEEVRFVLSLQPIFADPTAPIDLKVKRILPLIRQAAESGDRDLTGALLQLTRILEEVHPDDAKGYAASADLFYFDGQIAEARRKYELALDRDDTVYPVWEQYLYLLAEQRDFPALESASEDALDIFPNQAIIYYLGGLALQKQKKNEAAAGLLQQALIMTAGNPQLEAELQCLLGTVYNQKGQKSESDEAFAKALQIMPEAAPLLTAYSLVLAERGEELKKASDMIRRAARSAPDHPDVLHAEGWIQYKKKNYAEAEEKLNQAIQQGARLDPILLEHYGDLQFQRAETDLALTYWKKAQEAGNASPLLKKKIADRQLYE